MTAWQRTQILRRHEKGIGAVSFKRLLLAGGAGALTALAAGRLVGFAPSCLGAGVVAGAALALTQPVEGLPLLAFGLRSLRGLAAAGAAEGRRGPAAWLARALRVTPEEGLLRADELDGVDEGGPGDLLEAGWEYLGRFAEAPRAGLAAVANPFAGDGGGR